MIRAASSGLPLRMTGSRLLLAAGALVLAAAAAAGAVIPSGERPARVPALTERLGAETYGLAIPVAWLAAPIPGLRENDVLDMLGTRSGERATAQDVASGLRVMTVDDRTLVVELTSQEASAITAARARGLSLIPIVRSAN